MAGKRGTTIDDESDARRVMESEGEVGVDKMEDS